MAPLITLEGSQLHRLPPIAVIVSAAHHPGGIATGTTRTRRAAVGLPLITLEGSQLLCLRPLGLVIGPLITLEGSQPFPHDAARTYKGPLITLEGSQREELQLRRADGQRPLITLEGSQHDVMAHLRETIMPLITLEGSQPLVGLDLQGGCVRRRSSPWRDRNGAHRLGGDGA